MFSRSPPRCRINAVNSDNAGERYWKRRTARNERIRFELSVASFSAKFASAATGEAPRHFAGNGRIIPTVGAAAERNPAKLIFSEAISRQDNQDPQRIPPPAGDVRTAISSFCTLHARRPLYFPAIYFVRPISSTLCRSSPSRSRTFSSESTAAGGRSVV